MKRASILRLNNGFEIPAIGLGVFQTPPEETARAVESALAVGYRHIDTAAAYANEREVGEAIRRSGLDRDDVFIETKVWISDYGYEETLHAFDKSAAKLGVERIDLLLLHHPLPSAFDRTTKAYQALEKLLSDGKVRAIGVSNFLPDHLDSLLEQTEVAPAVNQIEVHPYFTQVPTRELDARYGILTKAWSPIGGITSYRDRMPKRTFRRPDAARDRAGPQQVSRAGDAALAPAAGPLRNPEVRTPGAHRRELRHLRLRAEQHRTRLDRRARHRDTRRPRARRRQPRSKTTASRSPRQPASAPLRK
jgi:diketogulonate reductase-like aldo/keto reductase